jgi:hypothetical protein
MPPPAVVLRTAYDSSTKDELNLPFTDGENNHTRLLALPKQDLTSWLDDDVAVVVATNH